MWKHFLREFFSGKDRFQENLLLLLKLGGPKAGIRQKCGMAENAPAVVKRISGGAGAVIRRRAVADQKNPTVSVSRTSAKYIAAILRSSAAPDMTADTGV